MLRNFAALRRNMPLLLILIFVGINTLTSCSSELMNSLDEYSIFAENDTINSTSLDDDELTGPVKKKGQSVDIGVRFFISLGMNLTFLFLIVALIYYPNYKRMDTVFTFVMFNMGIFLLTYVFNVVKISMGAAFGLFAVFSMLRYRTMTINMKDMTYLFIFIALGLLNAIQMRIYEQAAIGFIFLLVTFIMDTHLFRKRESVKMVRYDDVKLIHPDKEEELINNLRERTGLEIHRVTIEEIDYLRDIAKINIYYYEK
jgi:hypothetical protein